MYDELIRRDRAVNWHPYSQMKTTTHIPVVAAKGALLFDAAGKSYIDAISSWWVTIHGHAHPYIAYQVYEQLQTLEQVIFAGFTHPAAIELSERLLALLPSGQAKVFYSDNGSTAVEVALKMCIQYAHNTGKKKSKIIAFKNGYHGDTFGAMSVSERNLWTLPFADLLFEVVFVDPPTKQNLMDTISQIEQIAEDTLCFIYEPLVQGSAGMLMHDAEDLSTLLNFCSEKGIFLIQDEVFVGFGRTGTLFAADQISTQPDIMCFSKGLTGGTMPLGVTSCTQQIYDAFYDEDRTRALFHGHSFTANPVACSASLASLDLLLQDSTLDAIKRISNSHEVFATELNQIETVRNVRQCGTILAFDWNVGKDGYFNSIKHELYKKFLAEGVLLRPLGNTVYVLPPYCISEAEIQKVYEVIRKYALM